MVNCTVVYGCYLTPQNAVWYYHFTIDVIEGVSGRIPNFKRNSGNDADIKALLTMRSNIVNYVHVIDIYAPCVVKSSIWNRDAIMTQYCGDNASNFHEYVLSISDEAFLLLVLINYSATWMAEIEDEYRKVCCLTINLQNQLQYDYLLTRSNSNGYNQITAGQQQGHMAGMDTPSPIVVSVNVLQIGIK